MMHKHSASAFADLFLGSVTRHLLAQGHGDVPVMPTGAAAATA